VDGGGVDVDEGGGGGRFPRDDLRWHWSARLMDGSLAMYVWFNPFVDIQ
jgi:hypothetical protein